jgi:uncharacterized protein YacL
VVAEGCPVQHNTCLVTKLTKNRQQLINLQNAVNSTNCGTRCGCMGIDSICQWQMITKKVSANRTVHTWVICICVLFQWMTLKVNEFHDHLNLTVTRKPWEDAQIKKIGPFVFELFTILYFSRGSPWNWPWSSVNFMIIFPMV